MPSVSHIPLRLPGRPPGFRFLLAMLRRRLLLATLGANQLRKLIFIQELQRKPHTRRFVGAGIRHQAPQLCV